MEPYKGYDELFLPVGLFGTALSGQDPGLGGSGGSAVEGVTEVVGGAAVVVGGAAVVVGGAAEVLVGALVEGGGSVMVMGGGAGGVVGPSTERNVHLNPWRLGL